MPLPSLAMALQTLDWIIIGAFFAVTLLVGLIVAKRASKSSTEFFLSGRTMPWWLLGFSMVATTFSTDTPNLVTDFVRQGGVAQNWDWWAFLLTGMLTVFVYAKLWRRSGITTDVEFYELRYSGKPATFLRAFRALYLGLFFNILIMATVTLAAIKIGGVMFNFSPMQTVLVSAAVTVAFSAAGGFLGVLITDFLLFIVAMIGAIFAAYVAVSHEQVGGLSQLLAHPNVQGKLSMLPDFTNYEVAIPIFVIPIAVQWWNVWYPGAEPGGGGYIAQRMLAAKNENNAVGATFFFNVAHYALRPWPWILVALASLVVFPDLESLKQAFPHMPDDKIKHDLAYSAMLTFLPAGWLGLVVASLIAAYISTISTHLNWGSSYIVNDFWKRFIAPKASERELVFVGRVSTVLMMACAAALALLLSNSIEGFQILLQVGAGTGLIYILRWFWWRINAYTEITAMIVSFLVSLAFFLHEKLVLSGRIDALVASGMAKEAAEKQELIPQWQKLLVIIAITTVSWLTATFLSRPTDDRTLRSFYRLTRPGGPGWAAVVNRARAAGDPIDEGEGGWPVPLGILCMVVGCAAVYSALFATGHWIYGNHLWASILTAIAVAASIALFVLWGKLTRIETAGGEVESSN